VVSFKPPGEMLMLANAEKSMVTPNEIKTVNNQNQNNFQLVYFDKQCETKTVAALNIAARVRRIS
jgi:hypothetical protein